MGLRFHRSFQLFPGVRLNLRKGGVSASFGVPGATVNVGPRGVQSTIGIPGTGVSFRQYYNTGSPPRNAPPSQQLPGGSPPPQPSYYQPFSTMREINSASVEELTSESLVELREMISQARSQRGEIEADLAAAKAELSRQSEELAKRQRSIFRIFYKRRIDALETSVPEVEAEVERLQGWLECTHITVNSRPARRQSAHMAHLSELSRICAPALQFGISPPTAARTG